MANIDLNKLFAKRFDLSSPVDSEINLNQSPKQDILFSDFKLDLSTNQFKGNNLNSDKTQNDLATIINEESILNSLRNIICTKYGSRLLNPEINFDLRTYLFDELTESKAYFIGYDICTYLPMYEPRISIKKVKVTVYYDSDAYVIDLQLYIPAIDKSIKLSSILNSEGFFFD